ncbi:hypothetical protein CBM2587_A110106 [Cupriavidus taiwanensis]|uniref:Uncharacterized protein n=1 Tax=Cupriavidus taiwanensis TaxID=164546 RepID=A0A975ZXQ7_9BURK|nr:hypothetical protein CBM2587_A110106 [Cupriavidus taiwanensis]
MWGTQPRRGSHGGGWQHDVSPGARQGSRKGTGEAAREIAGEGASEGARQSSGPGPREARRQARTALSGTGAPGGRPCYPTYVGSNSHRWRLKLV